MIEKIGNLWNIWQSGGRIAITTNGHVKANGACVMGRGIALEATRRFPGLDKKLGSYIGQYGNRPFNLGNRIVTFPVKPIRGLVEDGIVRHMKSKFTGKWAPGWACVADIDIIMSSATKLVIMADKFGWDQIAIPRPGCGAGEMNWKDVGEVLHQYLDDRFTAYTFG